LPGAALEVTGFGDCSNVEAFWCLPNRVWSNG